MAWKKRGENSDGGKFPGGTWHIFPIEENQRYVNGELKSNKCWRGVIWIKSTDKLIWKAAVDKKVIERWVKDKIVECRELPKPKIRENERNRKKTNRENAQEYLKRLREERRKRRDERKRGKMDEL